MAGYSSSYNGDVSGNHDSTDVWVVKLNSSGNIQWQKCLGGTMADYGYSIQQTTDGGYILIGTTDSNNGDVSGNHGCSDVWVVKLNSGGNIQWQKCLGGTSFDYGFSIQQTTDGGYILTGQTDSNNGDVSGIHFNNPNYQTPDVWLVKLSSTGAIQWQKCLGGSSSDSGSSIEQTIDGGYIVVGSTSSINGDVIGNHFQFTSDVWVVKLGSTGAIQWQKCLGGTKTDFGNSILQTLDGGYIVAGGTDSNDGDALGNHQTTGGGGIYDAWVVKLSSAGNIQWQKCLGGGYIEKAFSIQQTADGGYIVLGGAGSDNGDVIGNHGPGFEMSDAWTVKLNSTGEIQWQKCLGGSGYECGYSINQVVDGGYILTGRTQSNDGDVSGNHGKKDSWVVKLSSVITSTGQIITSTKNLQISPNPATSSIILKSITSMVGKTYEVFNVQGKTVLSGRISAEEMQLFTEGLPVGIYTILTEGQAAKLVKE